MRRRPTLSFRLAEGSGGVDGYVGVKAFADGSYGGKRRTDFEGDAGEDQLPAAVAVIARVTSGSSNALTVERSMIETSGSASLSAATLVTCIL